MTWFLNAYCSRRCFIVEALIYGFVSQRVPEEESALVRCNIACLMTRSHGFTVYIAIKDRDEDIFGS